MIKLTYCCIQQHKKKEWPRIVKRTVKTKQCVIAEEWSVACLALKDERPTLGHFTTKNIGGFLHYEHIWNLNTLDSTSFLLSVCYRVEKHSLLSYLSLLFLTQTSQESLLVAMDKLWSSIVFKLLEEMDVGKVRRDVHHRPDSAENKKYNPCVSSWRDMARQRFFFLSLTLSRRQRRK